MTGRNVADGWSPFLYGVRGLDGLAALWAKALSVALSRTVAPSEVRMAVHTPADLVPDPGRDPAVRRWLSVPPAHRFVPPGIRPDRVDRRDIAMWLKVGAVCERNGERARQLPDDPFDIVGRMS